MTNKKPPTFGEWLTRELEARQIMSNVKAGELLNVSHSTVGQWKKNAAEPSLANFEAIAKLLHMKLWRVLAAAGKLDAGEMGQPLTARDLSTDELMAEARRRMTEA